MNAHTHCPHCHAPAPKTPKRWYRSVVVVGAWTLSLSYVFGGSLLGPAVILGVLPILILAGIAVVTEAHRWADADVVCDECGKLIVLDGELVPEPLQAHEQVVEQHEPQHEVAA